MDKEKKSAIASLVCNITVILITTGVFAVNMINGRSLKSFFMFYTNLTNVLVAVCGAVILPFNVRVIKGGKKAPEWAVNLRYISACMITLTFMTVLCLLAPIQGIEPMYGSFRFFTHLIVPVISVVSFILFESGDNIRTREVFTAFLPTVVYGAVYYIEVGVLGEENGGWPDIYMFIYGRVPAYISFLGMLTAALLICFGIRALCSIAAKRRNRNGR